jgi:hypothetical protein
MRFIKFLFLVIIAQSFVQRASAQVSPLLEYSEEPVKFLEELKVTLEYSTLTNQAKKAYLDKFTEVWTSAQYSDNFKMATYNTLNLMVRKRIMILPNYLIYLNSVSNFVKSGQSMAEFEAWQNCVMNLLYNESVANFSNFLDVSENLFLSNIFYKTLNSEYSSTNNKYAFTYDKEPIITFDEMDLRCYNNQRDSGVVYGTKGVYRPNSASFVGQGGTVYWDRTGCAKDKVWAELKNYTLDLKRVGFTADSAMLYHKEYFDQPLMGFLTEKVVSETKSNVSYPRFEVYNKKVRLTDVVEGVDYIGGVLLRGAVLLGVANTETKAHLVFTRSGKPFIRLSSETFVLSRERLDSEGVTFTMYIDKDSITHPQLILKYDAQKQDLILIRSAKGLAKSPFLNSYHGVNMYFEELNWNAKSTMVDIKMLRGNASEGALFESVNFFRVENYSTLQGLNIVKELNDLRVYVNQYNDSVRDFTGEAYAAHMKTSSKYLLPTLIYLGGFGFLTYDGVSDMLHVNDKVFDYLGAYAKKLDYDVILFPSFTNGNKNAELDLVNNNLQLYGVREVFLSDSQGVSVTPSEQKLILKKNRDFDFKGVVNAGRFRIYGKDFEFFYDKFNIKLNDADSVRMKVTSIVPDVYGETPLRDVQSVIEKINGTLQIDAPKNKSGLKPFSRYPILTSAEKSFVYYDKKYIRRGSYSRDKFYFHLDPFEIDSLDNFANDGIAFQGDMVSAGIFPVFREVLRLQPDYSLGFVAQTPADGYPLYGNKARFTSAITLNNDGLGGDGTLNYITSTSISNSFAFYPDSLNGIAQTYDVKEQRTIPLFPQVHGQDIDIHYMPYQDFLNARNNTSEKRKATSFIESHDKQAGFKGTLTLNPVLLKGRGVANFGAGRLTSKEIRYTPDGMDSDMASFALEAEDLSLKDALSFSTENINAHIDFKTRKGEFKSNGAGSIVHFPIIQYICFMQSFTWDMDNDDIEFGEVKPPKVAGGEADAGTKKDLDFKGLEFTSTHPKQDSLLFVAKTAKFSPRTNKISARGVEYINTADALVYPDSGNVFVDKGAVMRPFTNARISANSITKLHNLYNCTVNITGRKKYSGSGFYDYIDEEKKKQTFYFSDINVDADYQTYAETKIASALGFKLSPNFEFQGKVKLQASKSFLVFDGSTRLVHKCTNVPLTWFAFEAEINPDQVYIPIAKTMKSGEANGIAAAFTVTTDSTRVYTTFASPLKSRLDSQVLPADGFMFYDKATKEYRISNKEKLVERSLPGNYLSLSTSDCNLEGEGVMNFGGDFGQVEIKTFGHGKQNIKKNDFAFETLLSFNFFFSEDALTVMSKDMISFQGLNPVDYATPLAEKGLQEFLGKVEAEKLIQQITLYNEVKKTPEALRKTLFFTDVKFIWNKDTRSFTSYGPIGLGNIGKDQVNKYVEGKIEIVRKRAADEINIYLELEEDKWYFFTYTRGNLLAVSSNDKFNTTIEELKADKRKQSVKGMPNYYFNICPLTTKTDFLNKRKVEDEDEEEDGKKEK